MTTITIHERTESLYDHYHGQTDRQPCHLEIDPEEREISVDVDGEIGNAVPECVYHGRVLRIEIPLLTPEAANRLMSEIVPLVERICDGHDVEWDGSNMVGSMDDDAQAAFDELESLIETWPSEEDIEDVRDASDFFAGLGGSSTQRAELGIRADTTDEEMERKAEAEETNALPTRVVDVLEHMRRLRDDARGEELEAEAS